MTLAVADFELDVSSYKGAPVLEILKNGMAFYEDIPGAKSHFRFGVKKARVLLACMWEIKEFHDSGGQLPLAESPVRIQSRLWNIECELIRHEGFIKSGQRLDRPYIEVITPVRIAFGLKKAEALLYLQKEIEQFVMENP